MLFDLSANSNAVKLMELDPRYPQDVMVTVPAGESASVEFQVMAADPDRLYNASYQWYVNGEAVTGATAQTYTRDVTNDRGLYSVWCDVIQRTGTTRSRNASLVVKKPVVLSDTAPADAEAPIGRETSFSVNIAKAGYPDSYSYQWYLDGSAVAGATASTFTTSPAVGSHSIYCIVTNEVGSVKSREATLKVNTLYVFENGSFPLGGSIGGVVSDSDSAFNVHNGNWYIRVNGRGEWGATWATVPVNVDRKNRLIFSITSSGTTGSADSSIGYGYFGLADGANLGNLYMAATTNLKLYESGAKEISVDVSKLSGDYYVKIAIDRTMIEGHQDYIYVSSVRFE